MGPAQGIQIELLLFLLETQLVDAKPRCAAFEDAQNDLFAVHRWQGADAEVDGLGAARQLDATVLGYAPLCDVQLRHHLQSSREPAAEIGRRTPRFAQSAVHSQANAVVALVGFKVDVRSAGVHGIEQDLADESDDGRGVGFRFLYGVRCARCRVRVCVRVFGHQNRLAVGGTIAVYGGRKLRLVHQDRLRFQAGTKLDLVQGVQIGRVRNGHEHALPPLRQRQREALASQFFVDEVGRHGSNVEGGHVERRQAELGGHCRERQERIGAGAARIAARGGC